MSANKGLSHISKSVISIEKTLFEKFGYYKAMLYKNWHSAINQEFRRFCNLLKVKDNKDGSATVYIGVDNSVVALQLFYEKMFIIEKLNNLVGYNYVSDLKIEGKGCDLVRS